ncbi:glycoside hydrolase family 43 protein [Singulisphaera acidiphila]|uniref:Putative beta-xylosidase n=1 Tax=Singulisphaera acidiphila (strain ATCC BAA-1392 / DSM 18658 / VKM B-2454 / MOB10) TaxID=886293 RepID=L0DEF6_SINAD|nr:glycoside hydrolase family 43 protein [Singulisphaera acidiphila]AGA27759.1 putative beta-xylosidase [Singulisphaera acidiphila DSM 18658]
MGFSLLLVPLTFASVLVERVSADEPPAGGGAASSFRNPLKREGADPWVIVYNGWYYLSTTTSSDIRLQRARRLGDLKDAPSQVVWKDDHPARYRDLWAPEFHRFDSENGPHWYLYYTASDNDDTHHRMYVAESQGDGPLGPYTFKAKVKTDPDDRYYAIDGTILKVDGALYFLWCGRPSTTGQGLYLSRMSNPWTLTGPRVALPADGFGCAVVREGPVTLHRNGRIFLIYSACPADTPDYKLGMLIADQASDLMDPASWKQHPTPVFERDDEQGVFGPGHNAFFRSPDGKEDWIVYHAKSGTSKTYADRTTRAQRFYWNPDGTPNFGRPLPLTSEIASPSGEPPAR